MTIYIVSETDPASRQTRYQYDRFGRMTALLNPNHNRWQFDYDNGDRLLAQTDYARHRTQYGYDRLEHSHRASNIRWPPEANSRHSYTHGWLRMRLGATDVHRRRYRPTGAAVPAKPLRLRCTRAAHPQYSAAVWHNLLQRLGGTRWGFGRLNWRHNGPQGEEQRFSYDAEHRLASVIFTGNPHYQRAEYCYDALGCRSQKILYPHHGEPETITFHWNGLRMVGEQSSLHPEQATRYLYQENSWEPLARVDSIGESSEVYWYHTELNASRHA
ncbi:hypothetical protein [Gibbsiella quercinecans]|uniref:hypothetical protein n=1 Tax=Gibbsiella quercinecans TaxID=929813 RepID=UPI001E3B4A86|nr:hypothetical protein [Gibbsiella quercinecans]